MRTLQDFGKGHNDVAVRQRLQGAMAARAIQPEQLQSCVIKESRSPTGYGVVLPGGRVAGPLYLDTHKGPGFKIDAQGQVYYDPGF